MARPRKGTEEVWYDTFMEWSAEDQAAALKVLEALHRQSAKMAKRSGKEDQLKLTEATNG